jgi:imidazolonepropionase-like amidohydrolase
LSDRIILTNGQLIDGTGREPLTEAAVVIQGRRISDVVSSPPRPDSSSVVLDLKGKAVLPGLIDAHVHPGNVEISLDRTRLLSPAVYVHQVSRTLALDLQLGFTTLRDAAGLDPGFREAIDQGLVIGPRLLLSITPLNQTSSAALDRAAPLSHPRNSLGVSPEICDGPEEVRKATRRTLGRGADQIKIFADGEVVAQDKQDRAGPEQWKFSREEIQMAVDTANAAGIPVMAHAYSPQAMQNCIRAGVCSIEHGNLMDDETAQLMADFNTAYVPTLTVFHVLSRKGREAGLDEASMHKLRKVADAGGQALERAYRAGVRIGSGSDLIGPYQHLKGLELALKSEIMSPMEALVSATRTNAEILGLDQDLGTIVPGKLADLIVVQGDPLRDPGLFEHGRENVRLVIKNGQIVKNQL